MKKKGIIIIAVLLVIFAALAIVVNMGEAPAKMSKGNLEVVTAPDQEEAMENENFIIEEYVPPVIEGKNVALNSRATANGFTDVYTASYAVDGRRESTSYWEGPEEGDSVLTVNLKKSYNIHTIRIGLNPDTIWGKRTQTLSVSVSEDGKEYKEITPLQDFFFDPKTGNEIVIEGLNNVKAKYVQVTITKNTGAKGGQIAELEVYSND